MTLTHAQLLDAVRAAGRDRESFTCADVRQQLGLSTGDRKLMNRFYKLFGALQKDAASQIEKLGNNCYRLRASSATPGAELAQASPPAIAVVLEAVPPQLEASEPVFEAAAEILPPAVVRTPRVEASPSVREPAHVALAPARPTPASKPRVQWLSRMLNFFRRGDKSAVSSGIAVGA
jgi:hypothetical protein